MTSARRNLLGQYHHFAAEALRPLRPNSAVIDLLEAAEGNDHEKVNFILQQWKGIVNLKCDSTGDTALIAAARNGHKKIVDLLLKYSADCTLQNDNGETVLDVAPQIIRKQILSSITGNGKTTSNGQSLLHSAWLGDAVSVKKSLTGNRIDVNCRNSDGLTPLLLVTRDITLFDKVQHAMQTDYNPVDVMQQLIRNHADTMACDKQGRSALHLVATNESIQAKKMVSLLLQNGGDASVPDDQLYSPLHVASESGHTAIIIALIEEGNANVNQKGGEKGDTPLMISARKGNKEAAQYLLSKGADVTVMDNDGDSAISIAKTPSLVTMLKEAWVEQTDDTSSVNEDNEEEIIVTPTDPPPNWSNPIEDTDDDEEEEEEVDFPIGDGRVIHQQPDSSFFITDRQTSVTGEGNIITRLESLNLSGLYENEETNTPTPEPFQPQSEVEADDELEEGLGLRRMKPATKRNQVRNNMEETIAKRSTFPREKTSPSSTPSSLNKGSRTLGLDSKHILTNDDDNYKGHEHQRALKERLRHSHCDVLKPVLSKSMESLHSSGSSTPDTPTNLSPLSHTPNMSYKKMSLPVVKSRLTEPGQLAPKKSSLIEHLPSLPSNLRPVALVAVDAEREKLHVQKFNTRPPPPPPAPLLPPPPPPPPQSRMGQKRKGELSRSKSLQHKISPPPLTSPLKRNSVGAVIYRQHSEERNTTSKVPLLPSVVAPQFFPSPVKNAFPHYGQRSTSKPYPLISSSSGRTTQPTGNALTSQLSVVSEGIESSSSDHTLTQSTHSQKEEQPSTLRAVTPTFIDYNPVLSTNISPQSPPNNIVFNYAVRDNDASLSPIWNQMQYIRSESESSTDYITSYIGAHTPLPPYLLSLNQTSNRKGLGNDSGQGESEEEKGEASSSNDSEEEEAPGIREVLKWKQGKLLGKGAYGKVWEGLMDSAQLIAVKEVELDVETTQRAQAQFEKIQLEVDILRSLFHKNIVRYLGAAMENQIVYIFMEYISGGSLQSILKRFGSLDEKTICHYTRQVTKGLEYLHNKGIIHRDIKGANIMVTSKGVVKLIDFGCAKRHCQELSGGFHSVRGTPYWMSPEVICGHGYGRKSDVWSLGCTVHEMATTKPPWGEFPPEAAMFQIGIGQTVPGLPDHLPTELKDLFSQCLRRDPSKRPTAHEVLQHPFLVQIKHKSIDRKHRKK